MMIYKGFEIDTETFLPCVTVFYQGDELAFDSIQEAQEEIDRIIGENTTNTYKEEKR